MSTPTKQDIAVAFLRLLARKPFRKITVRNIVEECGINRTTFYYHYQDVYAIIEGLCENLVTPFKKVLLGERDEAALAEAADTVIRHRKALCALLDALGYDTVRGYIYKETYAALQHFIDVRAEGLTLTEAQRKAAFLFSREALFGALYLFLRDELPKEGSFDTFTKMTEGLVREMLERVSKGNEQ